MNHGLLPPLIAAAAGIIPVASSAEKRGEIGSRSEASISINVSVAPRVQVPNNEMMRAAASSRLPVMCLVSNLPPASFTMTALPNPGSERSPSAGDPRQAAISRSSAGCGSSQNMNTDVAMLALWAPEAAPKDRPDQGPLVLIVRPE